MKRGVLLLLVLFCFGAVHQALAAYDLGKDIPGAKDIPGLPRYEGSVIIGHEIGSLVKDFGIAALRLTAKGVAGLAPVTTNANEAGRAKNRRVEMVLK